MKNGDRNEIRGGINSYNSVSILISLEWDILYKLLDQLYNHLEKIVWKLHVCLVTTLLDRKASFRH